MILLATRKRPNEIKRFFDYAVKAQTSHTILLGIDADDDSYDKMDLPSFMFKFKVPAKLGGAARVCQHMYTCFPDEPWYANLGDDVLIHTPFWDRMLSGGAVRCHIITAKSSDHKEPFFDHMFLSGKLLSAMGGFNHFNFRHFCADVYMRAVAFEIGISTMYTDTVFLEHLHPAYNKVKLTKTYWHYYQDPDASRHPDVSRHPDMVRWPIIKKSKFFAVFCDTVKRRFKGEKIALPDLPEKYQDYDFANV
ncbi:MAG: hypothetical protein AAF403_06840 [Pseudomonadota bacterium]